MVSTSKDEWTVVSPWTGCRKGLLLQLMGLLMLFSSLYCYTHSAFDALGPFSSLKKTEGNRERESFSSNCLGS